MNITMSETQIQNLQKQIADLTKFVKDAMETAQTAADSAKGSAAVAYQASVENVKSNRDLSNKLDNYITDDTAWKKEQEPYLKALANITGAGKIMVIFAVGISAVIGAWVAVKHLFR